MSSLGSMRARRNSTGRQNRPSWIIPPSDETTNAPSSNRAEARENRPSWVDMEKLDAEAKRALTPRGSASNISLTPRGFPMKKERTISIACDGSDGEVRQARPSWAPTDGSPSAVMTRRPSLNWIAVPSNIPDSEWLATNREKQQENAEKMRNLENSLRRASNSEEDAKERAQRSSSNRRQNRLSLSRIMTGSGTNITAPDEDATRHRRPSIKMLAKGVILSRRMSGESSSNKPSQEEEGAVTSPHSQSSSGGATRSAVSLHKILLEHFKVRHVDPDAAVGLREESLTKARSAFLIPYNSLMYWRWVVFQSILVCFQLIHVPHVLSFVVHNDTISRILDLVVDVLFALDVFVQFRVARPKSSDPNSAVDTDWHTVAMNYIRSYLAVDLVSCIPFHLLPFRGGSTMHRLVRLPRVLRIFKLHQIQKDMNANISVRRFLVYYPSATLIRLMNQCGTMFLTVHLGVCLWHYVTEAGVWLDQQLDEREHAIAQFGACLLATH